MSELQGFTNTKVVIVGGAGFVGSNLTRLLLRQSAANITIIDNFLSAVHENVPNDERVTLLKGSITDDAILAKIDDSFDYVFHLSTYHGNQSSIHNPLADHENNTLTTLKLYEHLKSLKNIKKVVYSAAGCAVAEKTDDKVCATNEEAPISLDMDSPYSISKIIGEFYSVYYHKHEGLPTVRARFQNVFGPGEILGAGQWRGTPATVWRNVTPTFIYKSIKGDALPLENEGRGSRDFIFVEDICKGLMLCALKGSPGDVYNIASGNEITIRELAEKLNELTGNKTACDIKPRRPWDHSIKRFGSTTKAENELGFKASMDFAKGLQITVDWTKENLELIESKIARHKNKLEACGEIVS